MESSKETNSRKPVARKATKSNYQFSILQQVIEARNAKGVKRGELKDYAKYNTAEMARQRRRAGLTNKKNASGEGLVSDAPPSSLDHLLLVIRIVERYWAKGMILTDKSSYNSRYKRKMMGNYAKAVKHAKVLFEVTGKAINSTKLASVKAINELEAYAYQQYMEGLLAATRWQWQNSLNALSLSRCLMSQIIEYGKRRKLAKLMAHTYSMREVLDTNLCLAAYQLDLAEQKDAEAIAQLCLDSAAEEILAPTLKLLLKINVRSEDIRRPVSDEAPITVTFRGKTIPAKPSTLLNVLKLYLVSDMDLQELLVDGEATEADTISAFDTVLNLLGRLCTIARASKNSLARLAAKTDSNTIKSSLADSQWLYAYFAITKLSASFSKCFYQYQRAPSNKSCRVRIKLCTKMATLCHRMASTDLLKDDYVFQNILSIREGFIRGLRAVEVAKVHFDARQLCEGSLVLHKIAHDKHIVPANGSLSALERKRELFELEQDQSDLDALKSTWQKLVNTAFCRVQAVERSRWAKTLSKDGPPRSVVTKRKPKPTTKHANSLDELERALWLDGGKRNPYKLADQESLFSLQEFSKFYGSASPEGSSTGDEVLSDRDSKKGWFKGWF